MTRRSTRLIFHIRNVFLNRALDETILIRQYQISKPRFPPKESHIWFETIVVCTVSVTQQLPTITWLKVSWKMDPYLFINHYQSSVWHLYTDLCR